jgi:hypothetical protein
MDGDDAESVLGYVCASCQASEGRVGVPYIHLVFNIAERSDRHRHKVHLPAVFLRNSRRSISHLTIKGLNKKEEDFLDGLLKKTEKKVFNISQPKTRKIVL